LIYIFTGSLENPKQADTAMGCLKKACHKQQSCTKTKQSSQVLNRLTEYVSQMF